MKTLVYTVLAAAWLLPAAAAAEPSAAPKDMPASAGSPDEALIRDARERFNQAFASKDLEAISAFFAPEYHIVTGRSEQDHGGAGEKSWFEQRFTEDPTFVCRRTPDKVQVNAAVELVLLGVRG